jgi:hypothetical protein
MDPSITWGVPFLGIKVVTVRLVASFFSFFGRLALRVDLGKRHF